MKKLFATAIIIFICICSNAQQITFQKTYGGLYTDNGHSVQQTTDGGYIVAGSSYIGVGNYDFLLIKMNTFGDTLWRKTYGGTVVDISTSVNQTSDGGYIVAGYTYSFGAGNEDVYLIKTNANGDTLWTKVYGGINADDAFSVQQTTDGGYIVAGNTYSYGAGGGDVYLIKTNAYGDTLWTKTYGVSTSDAGSSVQQTTDGGYIVAGRSTQGGPGGNHDFYLIKTDSFGVLLWTKRFGGLGNDDAYSVGQTNDGGYIVAGTTISFGAGGVDVYLIKTDSLGNLQWSKSYGGTNIDYTYRVQQTNDNGYIVAGYTKSFGAGNKDVYLIKTDINGDTLWTKTYGGTNDDWGNSVQQTADGGYIITGGSKNSVNGSPEVYLIKTDSIGNSGCNDGSTATILTTTSPFVTSFPTIVSSTITIVTTPSTIVASGGTVTTLCSSVGISEIAPGNSLIISPNPSIGNFIISFEEMILKGIVEILNIFGENVLTENISNESKKEISLKNITCGIYFVKVFDGEKSYCKKLIVEHD